MAGGQIGAMAFNPITPALIDTPPHDATLEEWLAYRDDLQALAHLPGITTFFDEADANIAWLSQPDK
jgi:hypothetical protein